MTIDRVYIPGSLFSDRWSVRGEINLLTRGVVDQILALIDTSDVVADVSRFLFESSDVSIYRQVGISVTMTQAQ